MAPPTPDVIFGAGALALPPVPIWMAPAVVAATVLPLLSYPPSECRRRRRRRHHASRKLRVSDVQARRIQCIDVDLRATIKQDAVLVDQEDLSIGNDLSLDHTRITAVDPV